MKAYRRAARIRRCSICHGVGHDARAHAKARRAPKGTRRNPLLEEMVIKPFVAAAVGHVGGRLAKAATDRAVTRARKGRRR